MKRSKVPPATPVNCPECTPTMICLGCLRRQARTPGNYRYSPPQDFAALARKITPPGYFIAYSGCTLAVISVAWIGLNFNLGLGLTYGLITIIATIILQAWLNQRAYNRAEEIDTGGESGFYPYYVEWWAVQAADDRRITLWSFIIGFLGVIIYTEITD